MWLFPNSCRAVTGAEGIDYFPPQLISLPALNYLFICFYCLSFPETEAP